MQLQEINYSSTTLFKVVIHFTKKVHLSVLFYLDTTLRGKTQKPFKLSDCGSDVNVMKDASSQVNY